MTSALQLRRGTTAQHSTFTGLNGEVTYDSTKKTLVVHDNATVGGFPLATPTEVDSIGSPRVSGLTGKLNATTPISKFDLAARVISMRNASGRVVTRYSQATLTVDVALAGPAANGRDQAAAFAGNSWVYLYFIWNGTTLATLASATPPATFTGSTLPTGYTHWAFATTIRWLSINIQPVIVRGSTVHYDLPSAGANRVLSAGTATALTTVSLSAVVPPDALRARINFILSVDHNIITSFFITVRPGGSSTTGEVVVYGNSSPNGAQTICNANALCDYVLGPSNDLSYRLNLAPAVGGGAFIDVMAYIVANGDA